MYGSVGVVTKGGSRKAELERKEKAERGGKNEQVHLR